jgi:hypothetical protein
VAGEETHTAAEASAAADEEKAASVPHDLAPAEPDDLKDAKAS